MSKNLRDMTEEDFTIEMLTLQYIQGKATNSTLEYVELYRQVRGEIESAYKKTEGRKAPFNLGSLIT